MTTSVATHVTRGLALAARYLAPALALLLMLLTVFQRDFLKSASWTPVARNPVQWPSLMLLGPGGWLLAIAFVFAGLIIASMGVRVTRHSKGRARVAGLVLALVGVAVCLESLPPGPVGPVKALHDVVYPVIPAGWFMAAILLLGHDDSLRTWRALSRVAVALLIAFAAGLWGTTQDSIAQFSRYVVFLVEFVWLFLLARALDEQSPLREGTDGP